MKVYLVKNSHGPQAGVMSVRLTVDLAQEKIVCDLLYSTPVDERNPPEPIYIDGTAWYLVDTAVIDFTAIKNRREFADRTSFMLSIDWAKSKWSQPIPLYAVSIDNKMTAHELVAANMLLPLVIGFNVPFEDCSFSECDVTVNLFPQTGKCFVYGLSPQDVIESPYSSSGLVREMVIFPGLSVSGPDVAPAGSDVEFQVQVTDAQGAPVTKDATLYLESVNGILPKNRVRTVGGLASVKVMTTGLSAGDTVRLKAGFKFYSGAADKKVTLQ